MNFNITEKAPALVIRLCVLMIAIIGATENAAAQANNFDSDWLGNARVSLDFSTRQFYRDTTDEWSDLNFIGLDFYKVFDNRGSDFATLTFQPYLGRLSEDLPRNTVFENPGEWELTWRISNINFKVLDRGRLNLRVGHFEIPYGLEQNIDTNGTLRQFTFTDRGIKVDWGVTANGIINGIEYEVAASRGSGNDYEDRLDPYIFSGRIGTNQNRNMVFGWSFFDGEVLGLNRTVKRRRTGIDLTVYRGNWEYLLEASVGDTDRINGWSGFGEVVWVSPLQGVQTYLQFKRSNFNNDASGSFDDSVSVGLKWLRRRALTVTSEYRHSWFDDARPNEQRLTLQLRYRLEK